MLITVSRTLKNAVSTATATTEVTSKDNAYMQAYGEPAVTVGPTLGFVPEFDQTVTGAAVVSGIVDGTSLGIKVNTGVIDPSKLLVGDTIAFSGLATETALNTTVTVAAVSGNIVTVVNPVGVDTFDPAAPEGVMSHRRPFTIAARTLYIRSSTPATFSLSTVSDADAERKVTAMATAFAEAAADAMEALKTKADPSIAYPVISTYEA